MSGDVKDLVHDMIAGAGLKLDTTDVIALELTDVSFSMDDRTKKLRPYRRLTVITADKRPHYAHFYGQHEADSTCLLTDVDQRLFESDCDLTGFIERESGEVRHAYIHCNCGATYRADGRALSVKYSEGDVKKVEIK